MICYIFCVNVVKIIRYNSGCPGQTTT